VKVGVGVGGLNLVVRKDLGKLLQILRSCKINYHSRYCNVLLIMSIHISCPTFYLTST